MKGQDRYGILGTPLLSDAGNQFKMSAQNKMAPTATLYLRLRQKAVLQKERRLLDKTSLQATRTDDACTQMNTRPRPSHLEDVMDDEDKAYVQIRGMINRKRANSEGQLSTIQATAMSFLATSVDLPEIIPKQARTPLGYRELRMTYSHRTEERSLLQQKTHSLSNYQGHFFSNAMHQDLKSGLGYRGKQTTSGNTGDVESMEASHIEGVDKGTNVRQDSDEEDYMDQLANSGYRNLDVTEKIMSQRLKEGRTASTETMGARKRTLSGTGRADPKGPLFTSFVEWRGLDKQDTEWTEIVVPASFAKSSLHSSRKDQMETHVTVLPPLLQQEYRTLLQIHEESLRREAGLVQTSIAKSTREQDAKLRKIRGLVLADIESRFIGPQESEEGTFLTSTYPGRTKDAQNENCGSKHPREGQTNRTSQLWKPQNLLCKRLRVEVPKRSGVSSEPEEKVPLKSSVLSPSEVGNFQIRSVTNADGRRINISNSGSLLQDEIMLVGSDYDKEASDNNDKRPSRELINTIFANTRVDEKGPLNCSWNTSKEASNETVSKTKNESRGIHKTRAVDFF